MVGEINYVWYGMGGSSWEINFLIYLSLLGIKRHQYILWCVCVCWAEIALNCNLMADTLMEFKILQFAVNLLVQRIGLSQKKSKFRGQKCQTTSSYLRRMSLSGICSILYFQKVAFLFRLWRIWLERNKLVSECMEKPRGELKWASSRHYLI